MRILVTLDGSKFAEAVLGPAANLAGTSNAEVHLIKVVKSSEAGATRAEAHVGKPHSRGYAEAILQKLLRELSPPLAAGPGRSESNS